MPSTSVSPRRPARFPAGPLAVLAIAVGVAAWCGAHSAGFIDLRVYRMGGGGIGDGRLYDLAFGDIGLPYTYPPFAAVVMVPLAHVPWIVALVTWSAVSVLALAAVIARLLDVVGLAGRRSLLPVLLAASVGLEPVWSTLSFGQVNLMLMALIVLDVLPRRGRAPWRFSGLGVGIAAGIKLTPLVFVVYLALTGRVRAAGLALAGFAGTIAIGFVVDPTSAWRYWTGVAFDAGRVGGVAYAGNQSTLGVLARAIDHEPSTLLWLAVAGPLALAALAVAVLLHRRGLPALSLCLAGFSMLLASPISWDHHWVWAAPTAIALGAATPSRWRVPVVGAWSAVFASACVWWFQETGGAEYRWNVVQQVVGGGFFVAALALLLGCGAFGVRWAGGAGGADAGGPGGAADAVVLDGAPATAPTSTR